MKKQRSPSQALLRLLSIGMQKGKSKLVRDELGDMGEFHPLFLSIVAPVVAF
jgi:hypothetical protein